LVDTISIERRTGGAGDGTGHDDGAGNGAEILIATIDHPDSAVNAVDARLHHDFVELFAMLRREGTARAVVLTGSGSAFSAGGDMGWFPALREPGEAHALRRDAKQMIWDLLDLEIPIIAALNGSAAGLGASIALLCDIVVMAETAKIVDPHVRVGLVAGDGGAAIWPLLVGVQRAKRYLLTGDGVDAPTALELGLVTEICASNEVLTQALDWAERVATLAPMAVQGTKIAINQQLKQALLASFDVSTALEIGTLMSADHVEAVDAHLERRPPRFEGR
jgi:enoyl-CoA hydratase